MNRKKNTKGITIKIDSDENLTAMFDNVEHPRGINLTDVFAYWCDSDIQEAVAEMNELDPSQVTISRSD